jgi:hypothetical protein
MSTPIYKNEQAWRAYMLLEQSKNREAIHDVGVVAASGLLIYLISIYSVTASVFLAIGLLALSVRATRKETGYRRRQLAILEADPDIDL